MSKSQVDQYVTEEQIESRLQQLTRGSVVTRSRFDVIVDAPMRDIEWGTCDLLHRVYVHSTYPNFLPLVLSKDISIVVTPWGRLPIYVQVMTARLGPGVFYQSFGVLGILYCHQIARVRERDGDKSQMSVDSYVLSHWLFRWLHGFFKRRLLKLLRVQNDEDAPLRRRRKELRSRGVRFTTDVPDFINSNDMSDHAILPPFPSETRISLAGMKHGNIERLEVGALELLVKKEGDRVTVWPGICPHEGAKLEASHLCSGQLICPWHGRKFRPASLSDHDGSKFQWQNLVIEREGDELLIRPK